VHRLSADFGILYLDVGLLGKDGRRSSTQQAARLQSVRERPIRDAEPLEGSSLGSRRPRARPTLFTRP
jgi:hypothetical protein